MAASYKSTLANGTQSDSLSRTGTTPNVPASASRSPLTSFVALNASVFLYTPPSPTTGKSRNEPDLILLHGWMGATPQHISKYARPYQTFFPSSTIIAVTTSLKDCVFSSTARNVLRIKPVLEVLDTLHTEFRAHAPTALPPRILLHTFSNGGLYTTSLLLQEWKKRSPPGNPHKLNIHALIFDSSPGRTTMSPALAAMVVSLPSNFWIRLIGKLFLRAVYILFAIGYILSRKTDFVELARRDLLDTRLVPLSVSAPTLTVDNLVSETSTRPVEGAEQRGRRLYIYSATDTMVLDKDVEEHAAAAVAVGWDVTLEKFVGSKHAAHVLVDSERYWSAVKRVWDEEA